MAAIRELGTVAITEDTTIETAVALFEPTNEYLIEVIATKVSGGDGTLSVFIKHPGDDEQTTPEDFYMWLCHNIPLPEYNTFNTFKVGIDSGCSLLVYGSAGTSVSVQGVIQTL